MMHTSNIKVTDTDCIICDPPGIFLIRWEAYFSAADAVRPAALALFSNAPWESKRAII